MDMIDSQQSKCINLLAIYTLLPCFTAECVQKRLGEIARFTISILESFLIKKFIIEDFKFRSPSKIDRMDSSNNKLKINLMDKEGSRMENIKKEDPLLKVDLIDFF